MAQCVEESGLYEPCGSGLEEHLVPQNEKVLDSKMQSTYSTALHSESSPKISSNGQIRVSHAPSMQRHGGGLQNVPGSSHEFPNVEHGGLTSHSQSIEHGGNMFLDKDKDYGSDSKTESYSTGPASEMIGDGLISSDSVTEPYSTGHTQADWCRQNVVPVSDAVGCETSTTEFSAGFPTPSQSGQGIDTETTETTSQVELLKESSDHSESTYPSSSDDQTSSSSDEEAFKENFPHRVPSRETCIEKSPRPISLSGVLLDRGNFSALDQVVTGRECSHFPANIHKINEGQCASKATISEMVTQTQPLCMETLAYHMNPKGASYLNVDGETAMEVDGQLEPQPPDQIESYYANSRVDQDGRLHLDVVDSNGTPQQCLQEGLEHHQESVMCSEASSKTVQRIDPHQVRSQASGAQLVTGSLEDHQELSILDSSTIMGIVQEPSHFLEGAIKAVGKGLNPVVLAIHDDPANDVKFRIKKKTTLDKQRHRRVTVTEEVPASSPNDREQCPEAFDGPTILKHMRRGGNLPEYADALDFRSQDLKRAIDQILGRIPGKRNPTTTWDSLFDTLYRMTAFFTEISDGLTRNNKSTLASAVDEGKDQLESITEKASLARRISLY